MLSCGPPGGAGDIMGVGVPWDAGPMLYGDAPVRKHHTQTLLTCSTRTKLVLKSPSMV